MFSFENIYGRICLFFIKKRYGTKPSQAKISGSFLKRAESILFILPENEQNYTNSLEVIYAFQKQRKKVYLMLPEHKVNNLAVKNTEGIIRYDLNDRTRAGLPSHKFVSELKKHRFDVVIDLNIEENKFHTVVGHIIKANYKIGFRRTAMNDFYNVLFSMPENSKDDCYLKFLKYLLMF